MVIAIPNLVRLTPDGESDRARQSGLPKLTRWNTELNRFFDFLSILFDDSVVGEVALAQCQIQENTNLKIAQNIEGYGFRKLCLMQIGVRFSIFRFMNLHHRVEYVYMITRTLKNT